ncbi:MAG: MarR family transcriptional regulator [Nitrososphaerota archaeon]
MDERFKVRCTLSPLEFRVLECLKEFGSARFAEIKKALNTADKLIWETLKKLVEKGFVEKVERGLYRITAAGLQALEAPEARAAEAMAEAKETGRLVKPIDVDITPYIMDRASATIGYMVPRMREKSFMEKLKILLNFYATALTLDFFKRFGEKTEDIVKGLSVVRSAVFPPVEAGEEREAFIHSIIEMLGRLLRCRGFRERVAEKRRLTLILDFDFSGAQLSNEELREALFWTLVFEDLHKEGKI